MEKQTSNDKKIESLAFNVAYEMCEINKNKKRSEKTRFVRRFHQQKDNFVNEINNFIENIVNKRCGKKNHINNLKNTVK